MRLHLAILALFAFLLLPSLVHAEPVVRCTHRDDRPDLGSPVHVKTVSDHVPVWATFEVGGEDDD